MQSTLTETEVKAIRTALPSLEAGCWHFGFRADDDPEKRALYATLAVLRRLAGLKED